MKNFIFLFFLFSSIICSNAQITLSHNVGNIPIYTGMPNCEYEESWARVFTLSEFGITTSDQFIIRSGQVAISNSYYGARIEFSIFALDGNFPNTSPDYIGGGNVSMPEIGVNPEIVEITFFTPIVIPAGVERILVAVNQSDDNYNPEYKEVLIAGTENDNDISWFRGCREYYTFTPTANLSNPVPNANFYINVTGDILNQSSYGNQTTLTHNFCDAVENKRVFSCSYGGMSWSRAFYLNDFNISANEEYIIKSGQVALSAAGWGTEIQFRIYNIDDSFPVSFLESDLIGTSQIVKIPYFSVEGPKIFNIDFDTPVVVPSNVERILVEVIQLATSSSGAAFIAGSLDDRDVSWIKSYSLGCIPFYEFKDVEGPELGFENANFYINVTGNVNHVTNNFEMNIVNDCSNFFKEFSVSNQANAVSIQWDFGDPASGTNNTSTNLSPFHDFSADGTYTIIATVTAIDNSVEVLTEIIEVKEPPNVVGISDVYACEDEEGIGISSSFDVSGIHELILKGRSDIIVKYFDGTGAELPSPLPDFLTNTLPGKETIFVRVSHYDQPCCYSETSFDLIVNPLPDFTSISGLQVCDDNSNGFAFFNLEDVKTNTIGNSTNINVEFYHENGQLITNPLDAIENQVANEETITVRATNTNTNCYNEAMFKLIVNPLPITNPLNEIIGCDDNNDGISEYFDTSNIESQVLGNQTGMEVSYFDVNGNPLPSPLPNPYTNTISNEELITVRVTNPITTCFSETLITLKTASQPQINQPQTLYACDLGNGFANFDLTHIEAEIIGNQSGLKITYFDSGNNQLASPLSATFQNTQAWAQTIYVQVENELNDLCYSETSFNLIVNPLPMVSLEDSYFLCHLEPSLSVSVESNFDTYNWEYEDGTIISNTYLADLINAGNYTLTVGQNNNGIYCENTYDFELVRSNLPTITVVNYKELSDNNYIEIMASGDGDFEYSIDGINYQDNNLFNNVAGGVYNVSVRDKLGCGADFKEFVIVDYPKYFTPNGDGINDTWQIKGIRDYPNAEIFIYDRYGKLLKQIFSKDEGWDGSFRGDKLAATDYWFKVKLTDSKTFTGHFALKR